MLATTSKDLIPMMFAWDGENSINALKRLSETGSAYPIYPIRKTEKIKANKAAAIAPFPLDATLQGKDWESENHCNYHNISKSSTEVKSVAGFKNHEHVSLPTQFAWSRMNNGGVSDAEAAAGMCGPLYCPMHLYAPLLLLLLMLLLLLFFFVWPVSVFAVGAAALHWTCF